MQLDTTIPLQARIPEPIDPLGALSKVLTLKNQQTEGKLRDVQLQQAQQGQADTKAIDTAFANPAMDRTAILNSVPGHLRSHVQEVFKRADEDDARVKKAQTDAAEAAHKAEIEETDYVGGLAAGVKPFIALSPEQGMAAAKTALDLAKAHGHDGTDEIWQQIQASPDHLPQIIDGLIAKSTKYSALAATSAAHVETGRHNLATEATAAAAASSTAANRVADNTRLDAQAKETARHNVAMEKRPVAGAANQNVAGDFTKEGDDFLSSVPLQWRKTVEKIAHYDEDPTKVASMRSGMRETLMQWVNQVNPSYDASQFSNRAPTRKAFTTGTQGQQINAINTAIGHIDQLTGVADKLQSGGFVPGNAAWNTVRTMLGSDKVTNFDTLKDALSGEVASVLAKGGATVSGIAEAKEKIKAANSPQQLAGYVKTLIPVMGSKLASLDYQFHQAMGENDKFSALSPESKRILEKHGFDPAHPTVDATDSAKPIQVGGFSVVVKP